MHLKIKTTPNHFKIYFLLGIVSTTFSDILYPMSLSPQVLTAITLCHPPTSVPALSLAVENQTEGAVELPLDRAGDGHGHRGRVHLVLPPCLPAELTHRHEDGKAQTTQ